MEIVALREKEIELLSNYMPEGCLSGHGLIHLLGAVEGDSIKGFEIVRQTEEDCCVLTWIYVFDSFRRQGIASELLDFICKQTGGESENILLADYEDETEYTAVMDKMLVERGFDIESAEVYAGHVGRPALRNSFINNMKTDPKWKGDVFRLEEVPVEVLNDFLDKRDELDVHAMDIYRADKILSLALATEGQMIGLLLIEPMEGYGQYYMSAFYIDAKYKKKMGLEFLARAIDYLVETDELVQDLYFMCNDVNEKEFIDKIYSQKIDWEIAYMKHAILGDYADYLDSMEKADAMDYPEDTEEENTEQE